MKINSGVGNNGKQSSTKQSSTKQRCIKQRSTSEEKANLQNANSEKMNMKQKTENQSTAFPKNMVQRTKSQENTLQENVPQGDTPQENATSDSVQSKVAINRALILQKIELKHKLEKKYSGLQHSDDKEKLEIIEEIRDIIDDNGFDENFLREHSDCSESSIRRILGAWMCKSMSNWTTIFNMTTCLSVNCVFAEHLLALVPEWYIVVSCHLPKLSLRLISVRINHCIRKIKMARWKNRKTEVENNRRKSRVKGINY